MTQVWSYSLGFINAWCVSAVWKKQTRKFDGIGISRISEQKSPFYSAWREKVINLIKRYRLDYYLGRMLTYCNEKSLL